MRKIIVCISMIALLLSGCSSANQNENDKVDDNYIDKFNELYMNLSVLDISNEDDLSALFEKENKEAIKRGYSVVIIEKDDILKDFIELVKDEYGSYEKMYEEIKTDAKEVEVESFFNKYKEMNKALFSEWKKGKSEIDSYEAYNDLYVLSDNIYLAMIPSEHPYDVFAYIPMGNFNECPNNHELLAVFRHWYEEYGVIPAIITRDSVHVALSKTLSDDEIEQLAEEILLLNMETQNFAYSTKEDLVKGLKHSKYWMFWWD